MDESIKRQSNVIKCEVPECQLSDMTWNDILKQSFVRRVGEVVCARIPADEKERVNELKSKGLDSAARGVLLTLSGNCLNDQAEDKGLISPKE